MKVILDEKLFTLEEVGKMLGISKPLVSIYARERGVKTTIINRRKYINEEGIKKLLLPTE